jgi:hypothetical protein
MQLAVYREFGSLDKPQVRYLPEGLTLAELRARMTCLPHDFDTRGVICINGRAVYRKAWTVIRPKAQHHGVPVEITFHAPPMGGGGSKEGGGKNILALVAGIALTAITGFVAGGGLATKLGFSAKLFGAGTVGATLAAAGVSLVGSLLLSALVPPPVIPTGGGKTITNPGAASAEGNVLEPNGPIPRVLGQRKVYPPLASEPFTYFDGPDEVVEAMFVLNGPHQITDIRVGAAAIDGLSNVEYETREGWPGDLPISMVERQARTEALQSELRGHAVDASDGFTLESPTGDFSAALPQPITVATRDAPDEHWLHLIFPGGINRNASDTDRLRVPLRLRLREVGSVTWINLPELHFSAATPRQLRATIKLIWTADATSSPGAAVTEGWVEARVAAPAQTQSPAGSAWAAASYFDDGAGDTWVNSSNLGTTRVQRVLLNRYTATILLDTAVFPKGRYEIEIVRGQQVQNSAWSSSAYTVSGTVWDLFAYAGTPARIAQSRNGVSDSLVLLRSVSVWNEHPLPGSGLAVIAVRARNRSLERVSCVAGGYVRDWDGTDWRNWVVTSNPAPHYRDILVGWQNLDPVPLPIVDGAGLLSWRTACTALGYEVNALIEDATVDDALRIVGACGYAKPYQSEIWGVVRDYDRSAEAPVQIFTPRNTKGFQWTKAFARLPEGFRVDFRDSTRDYESHQITVFRPGVSSDTGRLEQVTYEGLVTEAEVVARAAYDLAQLEQRGAFYTLEAPAEAIICRRGDLVGVQHDALEIYSGSARVIDITFDGSGNITALKLDGAVPVRNAATDVLGSADILAEPDILALGQKTGAIIRRAGSITVHTLGGSTGDTDTLIFASAISPTGIDIGTLVSVGPLASEVRRLIVKDIEPGEDLTATIVMVDEAPGIVPDLTP